MEGTKRAILPHSKCKLNGKFYGEVGMFGIMCGWFGIPLVFVSGDKATVEEIKAIAPDINYVITKEAFSPYSARIIAPKKVKKLIREESEKALKRKREIKPIKVDPPFTFRIGKKEFKGDDLSEVCKYWNIAPKDIGNQDIEPERSRIDERRRSWQEKDSFLVP